MPGNITLTIANISRRVPRLRETSFSEYIKLCSAERIGACVGAAFVVSASFRSFPEAFSPEAFLSEKFPLEVFSFGVFSLGVFSLAGSFPCSFLISFHGSFITRLFVSLFILPVYFLISFRLF